MNNTQPKKDKLNLVWLDLEMTGLDPEKESIIEVATVITDSDLNIVAEGPEVVINQKKTLLNKMDDWNTKQHTKSGLIDLVLKSKTSLEEAEKMTLDFVKKYCFPKSSPLCGNSIHHDRRFLIKYMPDLNEYLHYRHIDVTTVKAVVQRWYKKSKHYPRKNENHRALFDVKESIEELKFLRDSYFVSNE